MQVLVGERKEAVVIAEHGFRNEFVADREVVEQMVIDDSVVPGKEFWKQPAGAIDHGHRVGSPKQEHQWMLPREGDQLSAPAPPFGGGLICILRRRLCLQADPQQRQHSDGQQPQNDVVRCAVVGVKQELPRLTARVREPAHRLLQPEPRTNRSQAQDHSDAAQKQRRLQAPDQLRQ